MKLKVIQVGEDLSKVQACSVNGKQIFTETSKTFSNNIFKQLDINLEGVIEEVEEIVNLLYQGNDESNIKSNHVFNLLAKSIVNKDIRLAHGFKYFLSRFQKEFIDSKDDYNSILSRVYAVYLTLQGFQTEEGYFDKTLKLKCLEKEYSELGLDIYMDELFAMYISRIDNVSSDIYEMMFDIKAYQEDDKMNDMYQRIISGLENFIKRNNIEKILVVPNNVVRKRNFNDYILTNLKEDLKEIDIDFIDIQVNDFPDKKPQKSLNSFNKRVVNANNLFDFSQDSDSLNCKKILILDDVVGSGATMNIISKKIKDINPNIHIIALSVLGSYRKGFEVVKGI